MMEMHTLIAVVAFATVTSVTPGPNNMMLLASGVNYGFRATVPHMLGISAGFLLLLLAAGLGLGALLQRWPELHLGLKMLGAGYMVWLAWKLWRADAAPSSALAAEGTAAAATSTTSTTGPLGFWGAAAFQWVNPKAWMMALGAIAAFVGPQEGWSALWALALLCAAVNLPCVSIWAYAGAKLSRWLAIPERRKAFNTVMAAALLLTIWPMLQG